MFSKYDICNRGLAEVGCGKITSFDDGTTEANVCGAIYEPKTQANLSAYPWDFAKKQFALTQSTDAPIGRWAFYYQQPSDMLVLRDVLGGGVPVTFDRYEDQIATDYNGDLIAEYTFRAPEILFAPYFVECLATELAAHFARAIRRDEAEGNRLDKLVNGEPGKPGLWAKARFADSQQHTAKKLPPSRFVGVRRTRGFSSAR